MRLLSEQCKTKCHLFFSQIRVSVCVWGRLSYLSLSLLLLIYMFTYKPSQLWNKISYSQWSLFLTLVIKEENDAADYQKSIEELVFLPCVRNYLLLNLIGLGLLHISLHYVQMKYRVRQHKDDLLLQVMTFWNVYTLTLLQDTSWSKLKFCVFSAVALLYGNFYFSN